MGTGVANNFKQMGEDKGMVGSENILKNSRITKRGASH
jgi:hypothetical protein